MDIHTKSTSAKSKQNGGGYYAIKGFLYQFDKTLIEVLTNRHTTVRFENRQDIDYEDFVLQVKHRETQDYTPSKIRNAIEGLLEFFFTDPSKHLCLYCHFRDKTPTDWHMTLEELDDVISESAKTRYPSSLRKQFLNTFTLRFSEDYESQFQQTLALIKSSFSLSGDEMAALYHSIFRSKLLDKSVGPKSSRKVRFAELENFLEDAEVRVFEGAYSKYIGAEKYARLIKKMYFTFAAPNIENFERLFIIECDSKINQSELIKFAAAVSRRFYKKGKSPQPYIIFRELADGLLKKLKQGLLDGRIYFFDGTHFDGDRFRLNELVGDPINGRACTLKIVSEHQVRQLVQKVKMKEVFQFFISDPIPFNVPGQHRRIQVKKTDQVLQMLI